MPQAVVRGRLARGRCELLVQWVSLDASSASVRWVDLEEFQQLYPSYKLEDELPFEGGRDVMVSLRYFRRNRGAKGTEARNSASI
jgi:hypothetical protein